ncbi:hypothetical protein CN563_24755 [Bacillus sp. AFS026049]|uniref:DNA/RNA helicase domain-containing protein n=1 Tax=Peribacillus frigoritolerans TaxID=450367 RepID=UPI000BF3A2BB|nr:hypothetical protein CN563_24755 [Bacillus sp. AFS026049]
MDIESGKNRCGWGGTLQQFLQLNQNEFNQALQGFITDASPEQLDAWLDSYEVLQNSLKPFVHKDWHIIFEYILPREGGRRPDVLLLLPGQVVVLEFKKRTWVDDADWEQLSSYVRDLSYYHETIGRYNLKVRGILIPTLWKSIDCRPIESRGLYISSCSGLTTFLTVLARTSTGTSLNSSQFLQSSYEPLPTIIEAARTIMKKEPLPNIRAVNNTNIPKTLEILHSIIQEARTTQTNHLALVTGVPGAGKTLVGLLLSHEVPNTVYLSGNGPLVEVLQDSLGNKTFIQSLYSFKREYSDLLTVPKEQILIFDEAQRAWDHQKMKKNYSEPDIMVKIAQNKKEWSVIVGLIGEGQEIHDGEEGGLSLWNQAIKQGNWNVNSTTELVGQFPDAISHKTSQSLNLNTSLRSHGALNLHKWVLDLLNGQHQDLQKQTEKLYLDRYSIYVTRSLDDARKFATKRYHLQGKQTGLMASSRRAFDNGRRRDYPFVEGLPRSQRYQKSTHVAYYNDSESDYYSSNLSYAATEFDSQGLELDLTIVCWGYDLRWSGRQWHNHFTHHSLKNPNQIRLNCYRVLLTRGRDGTILYIPDDRLLDSTYTLFKEIGVKELKV